MSFPYANGINPAMLAFSRQQQQQQSPAINPAMLSQPHNSSINPSQLMTNGINNVQMVNTQTQSINPAMLASANMQMSMQHPQSQDMSMSKLNQRGAMQSHIGTCASPSRYVPALIDTC